eukprot:CAMPEP_0177634496 /NCGR_PEP_ID=MMETSP0447-20121125/3398_1 /TAXON_ID=0 /ORGANISM="Stygamoeba regulata, Strain BSH-02190019" /LENGTH=582 /DNA_ID=CAMNT_0019136219 /DNA_START=483 /DNA_END=2227 /DNA_ORIENTATION=-
MLVDLFGVGAMQHAPASLRHAIEFVLEKVLTHSDRENVSLFVERLLRAVASAQPPCSCAPDTLLLYVAIARVLRRHAAIPEDKQKRFHSLWLGLCSSLFETATLTVRHNAVLDKLRQQIAGFLRHSSEPQRVACWTEALQQGSATLSPVPVGLLCWASLSRRHAHALSAQCPRDRVLAFFIEAVLGSKQAPSAALLRLYKQVFQACTHEELGEVLLPALVRSLKRAPEVHTGTLASLLAAVEVDLSRHCAQLVPVLNGLLVSKDAELARLARLAFRYLLTKSSVLEECSTILADVIARYNAANAVQRVQLILALAEFRHCLHDSNDSRGPPLSSEAAKALCELLMKERSDEASVAIMHELSHQLGSVSDISPAFIEFTLTKLNGQCTERYLRALLSCVSSAASSSRCDPTTFVSCVEPMFKVLQNNSTSPRGFPTVVCAMAALLSVARHADDIVRAQVLNSPSIYSSLRKDSFFMYSAVFVDSLDETCALAVLRIYEHGLALAPSSSSSLSCSTEDVPAVAAASASSGSGSLSARFFALPTLLAICKHEEARERVDKLQSNRDQYLPSWLGVDALQALLLEG